MRVVVQKVTEAAVLVGGEIIGEIGKGFMLLVGIGKEDSQEDVCYLARKVANLRVFEDEEGKMNR
ncbi:MAG TPA: D-aminoacyl-tRNA deacylase, partial [Trichococcus flocculiformis]|nr:D-aminoacyl-tRNA deacylase [Trichococcus flocculiformis]